VRLFVPLVLVAVLLPGCFILVTEPLSDPDNAELEKELLGKWQLDKNELWEIDSPVVKANPKGLMRARGHNPVNGRQLTYWFFTTKIGKDTYMTMCVDPGPGGGDSPDFRKEGEFKKWNKGDNRGYLICRYVLDGDKLTVYGLSEGKEEVMENLMQAKKIEGKTFKTFKTPPEWLAKYLKESGPQTLYDGTGGEYRRVKK
jgi:hypothetical protein